MKKYSIGTTYEGKDFQYLTSVLPFVSHIEVSPDSIAHKVNGTIVIDSESLSHLKFIAKQNIPLLLHGIGLSIGSYDGYSPEYIELLDQLFHELPIKWHSEHLAYTKVAGENLGTMLTLPRTDEVIEMVCKRIDTLQKKYKVPFLLENVISMIPSFPGKYSEAAFLNKITEITGCGLILDVYNLECDQINFGLDIKAFLDELDLQKVYEMHVAGGLTDAEFNFQMDIHAGLVSETTLDLALHILERRPANLQVITFEILEEFIEQIGVKNITAEIEKLSFLFNQNETAVFAN